MSNRKKLYRSAATTALILAAGIVAAPTIVTAGFHPSTKKVDAPIEQVAVEVAVESTEQRAPRKPHAIHQTPAADVPHTATGEETSSPSEEIPAGPAHNDFDGETTFALNDFAPPAPREFTQRGSSGAGYAVASNDVGQGIAKFSRKPKTPASDEATHTESKAPQASGPDVAKDDTATDKTGNTDASLKSDDGKTKPADIANNDQHNADKTGGQYADNRPHDNRPTTDVPEPSSIALLAAGLIGLVIARRRA